MNKNENIEKIKNISNGEDATKDRSDVKMILPDKLHAVARLNVRSDANINSIILHILEINDEVEIIKSDNSSIDMNSDWIHVNVCGINIRGYCLKKYLKK